RTAAGEAAYYLSDTIEPDDRSRLLALAEKRLAALSPDEEQGEQQGEMCAMEALTLLADAADEVEEMLRGPSASSELRIALRALRRAIGDLASHFGMENNHLNVDSLRSQRLNVLRQLEAKHDEQQQPPATH